MLLFTDLIASEGFVMGLSALGAVCAMGVCMLAWRRLRLLGTMTAVLVCMLSVHAAPPEKPIPKALPLTDKELAEEAKNRRPPVSKKDDTPMGRYYREVVGQVEKKWHAYLHLQREGVSAGEMEIVFYVNKKGKVEDLRVVNDKKSYPVLTDVTLRAIKDAEIPPIPADVIPLLPKVDLGRFKITYHVLIY